MTIRQAQGSGDRQGRWAVADQVLSSGTNFAVGILVARALGAAEFGAFALAISVWLVVMGLSRALFAQPYVIEAAPLEPDAWRAVTREAAGVVLVLAAGAGALVLAAGAILGIDTPTGASLGVLAAFLPALAVQDFWRLAAFSRGRARGAAANDAVWAIVQAAALSALWAAGSLSAATAVAAWGAGAAAGAVYGGFQIAGTPSASRASGRFARRALRTGTWFAASNLLHSVGAQLVIFIVAGAAGRAAVGGLRATLNLLGPVQLLSMATESVGLPRAARAQAAGPAELRQVGLHYSRNLTLVAAAYGSALVLTGPWLLPAVFGSTFEPFTALILPLVLTNVLGMAGVGAVLALRAARLGRMLVIAQVAGTAVKLAAVLALVGPHGAEGAAWALAIAALAHTAVLWWMLRFACRPAAIRETRTVLSHSTHGAAP